MTNEKCQFRPEYRRKGIPVWAFIALLLLAIGASVAWNAYTDYGLTLEQEYRLLEVRAQQREIRLTSAMRSVNLMLGSVIDDLREQPLLSVPEQNQLLRNYLRLLPELRNLLIVDANGLIQAEAKEISIGKDASLRDYFKHHRTAAGDDQFFLSRPFKTYSGLLGTTLTRVVRDKEGRFAGVVVASIESGFFENSLKFSTPDPSSEAYLINLDGDVISQTPGKAHIGKSLQGGIGFTEHITSGQQTTRHLNKVKFESATKLSVFQTLPDVPLAVIVSRDHDTVLAQWRQRSYFHVVRFLLLALALLFFAWLAARRQRSLIWAQRVISARELELRTVIETEPDCVKQVAADGSLLSMNDAGLNMVEADTLAQVLGKRVQDLVTPQYRDPFLALTQRVFEGKSGSLVFEICGFKGRHRWLETHAAPLRDAQGAIIALLGITRDITEQKKTEAELRNFKAIIDYSDDAIISKSLEGIIQTWNHGAEVIFGYTADEAIGQPMQMLIPKSRQHEETEILERIAHNERVEHFETVRVRKDGRLIDVSTTISPIMDDSGKVMGASKIARDVTEYKAVQTRIGFLASHDRLTELPNRDLFYDRLSQSISLSRRKRQHLAVLFLDLDGFKAVNDTHGHQVGDATLREAARRLQFCVREMDTVARLGGDEFAIILNEVQTRADAGIVADKIIHSISAPMHLKDGREYSVGISIGIALYPQCGVEIDSLVKAANKAMYDSKARGKNCFTHSKQLAIDLMAANSWVHFGESHWVGVPVIDAQHQKIAEMLNQLNVALIKLTPHDTVLKQFDEIIAYVAFHFQTEERLMEQYHYPEASDHHDEHQQLSNEVTYLKVRFSQDGELLVLQWLKDWFTEHIETADKRLGVFLAQHDAAQ